MPKFGKKKIIVGAVAAAVIASGAGAAYAYWTTGGTGDGSGTTATSNGSLTLHANFDASTLTPGGSVPVAYTADNTGSSNLYLTTLSVSSITTSPSTCLATDFNASVTATPKQIDAGATGVSVGSGTLTFANTNANQDDCKGATVTVHLSST